MGAQPARTVLSELFWLALLGCFRLSADTQAYLEHGAWLLSGQKAPTAPLPELNTIAAHLKIAN